jgi:hypothetical protein
MRAVAVLAAALAPLASAQGPQITAAGWQPSSSPACPGGAPCIELHTGAFCDARGAAARAELRRLIDKTRCAISTEETRYYLNGIYLQLLKGAGVQIVEGWATMADAHTVAVGAQRYSAKNILIATGGKPSVGQG